MTIAQVAASRHINNENQMNRIQVSNTKKPLFFYVNLSKRHLQKHNEIDLSAMGMAITTAVSIAEILKNGGFANEKNISISTVGIKDEARGRMVHKARIEIVLEKSDRFDSLMEEAMQHRTSNTKVANK